MLSKFTGVSIWILSLFSIAPSVFSQSPVQTIRGTVIDQNSEIPLPGATISINSSTFSRGIISDDKGIFRIEGVLLVAIILK